METVGSCHCGYIKFKSEISPQAIICHCNDCQVLSGSAYRVNVKAAASTFEITQGELKAYRKTAESGDIRIQTFCPVCATPIYSSKELDPEFLFVRIGALKNREKFTPAAQIWKRSELCNFTDLAQVPGSPEQQALTSK